MKAPWIVVAVLVMAGGACGSGDDEAAPETTLAGADYCGKAEAYQEATSNVDTASPESVIASFAAAAVAARQVADAAPAQVRSAHDALASAAESLVAGLRERAPATMAELDAASTEVVAELEAEFGDLEAETNQVEAFATEECGLTFG